MNPQSTQPIGVFDSGVGGLTVLDALSQHLQSENYVYFGDTLHMPYGNKSSEEITALAGEIIDWLCEVERVKLVAVACNTSAGVLYRELAERCPVPLVEPITPVCRWIAAQKRFQKIGLLATPTTVATNRYAMVLGELAPQIEMRQIPCEGLARMVETGKIDTPECAQLLRDYLDPLMAWGVEALILGCTHYPHARKQITQLLPPSVEILDPAEYMADAVLEILQRQNLRNPAPKNGESAYHVSQDPDAFLRVSAQLPLRHARVTQPRLTLPTSNLLEPRL